MAKICDKENCNNPVFSKGFCKYHYPKKQLNKISQKGKLKKEIKKELLQKDFEFYLDIWDNPIEEYHNHYCYECGKGISEPLIVNFHHILPKRNYPELRHNKSNICVLCFECHNKVETNIDFTPKIKQLTKLKLLNNETIKN